MEEKQTSIIIPWREESVSVFTKSLMCDSSKDTVVLSPSLIISSFNRDSGESSTRAFSYFL